MKSKYRNELKIINYIMSTERYKITFFLSVILALYGGFVLGTSSNNFWNSILAPLQFHMFNVLLFAIIFFNNMNVCSIFKNDFPFYIMRLKNKREYIKAILKLSVLMFLIHITIIFLFLLMCLLLTTFQNIQIYEYQNYFRNYGISNLVFCIFYCIRYILYGLLVIIISTLIYLNFSQKITIVAEGIFLVLMYYFGGIISLRYTFSILVWTYYTHTVYDTFSLEVTSSVFMLLLLEIVTVVLYKISSKNRRIAIS